MNNIITEKNKKRYLPHDINTRKYAVEMYRNCEKKIKKDTYHTILIQENMQ